MWRSVPRSGPRELTPRHRARRLGPLVLAFCLLASALPTPANAYEWDHYVWTYYLALQAGYTPRQAFQVASGAFAVDWDPDTAPMPCGKVDELRTALDLAREDLRETWRRYHAFVEQSVSAGGFELEEQMKQSRKDYLWLAALEDGNPGPLLHYTQDYHAHFGWEDMVGHLPAGHHPDFLGFKPDRARQMTEDTLAVLQRFQVEVLGQPSRPPDRGRIYQVLDELIAAHTPPLTEEQIQEAFPNRAWTDLPVLVDLVLDSELYRTLNDAAPSFDASLAIVRRAVREDERAGRLPWHSPGYVEGFESESIPRQWFEYQFDRDAHLVGDRGAYQVEKARLVLGEAAVRYTPRGQDAVTVEIDLPYRVEGLVDSPSFMMPLPVLQTETLSGEGPGEGPETWIEPTTGGEEHVRARFETPVASLRDGSLHWEAVVQPYGLAPELVEIALRLPEPIDQTGADTDTAARAANESASLDALLAELRAVVGAAVGAGERALGACRSAADAVSSAVGARAGIQAQFDRLAAARVAATDETAELGALLERARAAAARGNAAARELGPLRGEAGALHEALCEPTGASAGGASASRLAALERAANALYAEAERALAEVRSIADRVAGTGRGAGDATGDAAGILAALDQLESRLRTAAGLAAEAEGALAELGALRGRGSDLTQRALTALESVRGGAGSPATRELDQLFARMEAAADSAAACDPRDARSSIEAELAALDALRSRARELAGQGAPSGERERAEAAAALAALIADLEASVAAGELFRDSILERAAQGLTCADAPGDEHPPEGNGATGSVPARDGESAAGARAEAGVPPSPGWTIDSGVRTVAGAEAPAPAAPQPALPRSNPAADLVAAATAAFSRCDYVSALALADRAAAIDPGNPWVAANRARIATLAAQQTATANQLQVAQSLLGAGRLKEARAALVAAQRDAPGCMSGPIGTLVAEVNAASEERREANRTALSQGLGTLLGAIGQAATAVAASRGGVAAMPPPAATPGARAAGPGVGGVPAGQTAASCYLLDWGGTVSPQQFDAEFTRWYVQAKRMPQGFVYSITPVGSPDMDEAQHQQALAYLRQTVGADYVGPYRSAAAAWQAAQSRCPNVVRSPPG